MLAAYTSVRLTKTYVTDFTISKRIKTAKVNNPRDEIPAGGPVFTKRPAWRSDTPLCLINLLDVNCQLSCPLLTCTISKPKPHRSRCDKRLFVELFSPPNEPASRFSIPTPRLIRPNLPSDADNCFRFTWCSIL